MNTLTNLNKERAFYPVFIINLCAMFLFYKYILQVYPSIITDDLMREYHLNAQMLGQLAAAFYYTYMITQVFVGLMLDRLSMKWLTGSAIFISSLGVLLFSQSASLTIALVARGLMGIGVAFATVSYMKAAAEWFRPTQYAFVGGLLPTAVMLGAVFGQTPLSLLMNYLGWRETLYCVGIFGVLFALLFVVTVQDKYEAFNTKKNLKLTDVLALFKNKQNWLLTLYSGLAFSPIAVFCGLWGNPFLQQAYQINNTDAAALVSLVFIAFGLGGPVLGALSNWSYGRKRLMLISTFTSACAFTISLYIHLPIWLLGILLSIFGFGLGSFMLVFTIGKELNPAILTASVIAMINSSDAFLDAFTEPMIGKILDHYWNGRMVDGVPYFSVSNYQLGLSILVFYLFAAVLLLLWIKDTK